MKHAQRLTQIALLVLLLIAAGLTVAVVKYGTVSFWAGMLAAYADAILVSLAWWGLRLARQQQELAELGGPAAMAVAVRPEAGMGLSAAEDNPAFAAAPRQDSEVRTLETGFQRVVVILASVGLLIVSAVIAWMVVSNFWNIKPGEPIAVSPSELDNGALVAAIGALFGYFVLYSISRLTARTQGYGEATHGIVAMGLPSAAAVAVAVLLGYFKTGYAGEVGAALVVFFLLLHALELFFNGLRNYAGIEEFDQEVVDLQALPLVPMLTSHWILGLRVLLAQSFGLVAGRDGEAGVFARVMPRVIIAVLVVLVGASTLRVVPQGTEAIRERLGYASDDDISHPFKPGLHIVAPWPIDKLVVIPTAQLQQITVGADEVVPEVNGKKVDFSLWTTRHTGGSEQEMEYVTGDRQLLGGFVGIWWRVKNPSDFYRHISHSDFYGSDKEGGEIEGRPIYESLVQENAIYAVVHIFSTHDLEEIMAAGRGEAQAHCKVFLQQRLDNMGLDDKGNPMSSGIEIVDLTIKDVHPPQGAQNEMQTAGGVALGPARAYEDVVRAREYREMKIDQGKASRIGSINQVAGDSAKQLSEARGDSAQQVNTAIGDTAYMTTIGATLAGRERVAETRLRYQVMEQVLPQINKIFVGQNVKQPRVVQAGNSGNTGMAIPLGQPGQ